MGIIDDTSYARTAQLLAETGHIIYNGWGAVILGWQLYWGALFIKLFGFSFNATRFSTLPVAMASLFLSQRSMVRCGLTEWNATLATLTLALSPLFLSLTFSYMSDIGGYFVLALCFYVCLRALQAEAEAHACWWIVFAAISNGTGGTVRQTSWLGLLVIIPSTLWLLRGRRKVLFWGVVSVTIGFAMMIAAMHWYKQQPGALPEPLWRIPLTKVRIRATVQYLARLLFDAPLFLLPILLLFLPKVEWRDRKSLLTFLAAGTAICALLFGVQHNVTVWLEPTAGNFVSREGILGATPINGNRPVLLTTGIRAVLTALVIAGVSAFVTVLRSRSAPQDEPAEPVLSWSSLKVLALPFSAVYIALMIPRAGVNMIFDRYLLPLLFLALLAMARVYQERIARQLPRYTTLLLAVVAIYSIGVTHDAFAMLRARLDAARQLQARGVPDKEIDAGWEFNTWTVLNGAGVLVPFGGDIPPAPAYPGLACPPPFPGNILGLDPKYTLSYDPNDCGGQVGIPPVHYREWFGPRNVNVYIVSSRKQPMRAEANDFRR